MKRESMRPEELPPLELRKLRELDSLNLRYPLMVKPNFEGSSMGIRADSVVDDPETLQARVTELLGQYAAGVLIEEYVLGRDVVVPFLEKASPATGGVLDCCTSGGGWVVGLLASCAPS